MEDKLMCTARNCPYSNKCYRHTRGEPDDVMQCFTNLEYTCCLESGFDLFVPIEIESVSA